MTEKWQKMSACPEQSPNSPIGAKILCTGETDGLGSVAGTPLNVRMDVQSIETDQEREPKGQSVHGGQGSKTYLFDAKL